MIYYFKDSSGRKRFVNVNNSIELFRKIQSGEMKLEEAKKTAECVQMKSKQNQEEGTSQKNKKVHLKILNCFTNYEKRLLNYLMIILQL